MSGRPHKSLFAPRGLAGLVFAGCTAAAIVTYSRIEPAVHAESSQDLIEQAIYTREEFFGAEAVIPVPTAELGKISWGYYERRRTPQQSSKSSASLRRNSEITTPPKMT